MALASVPNVAAGQNNVLKPAPSVTKIQPLKTHLSHFRSSESSHNA